MILKRCSCGREFTSEQWDALPSKGPPMKTEDDEHFYETECKDCPSCKSTMAIETVTGDV